MNAHIIIIGAASSVCSDSSSQKIKKDLRQLELATSIQTGTTQLPCTAGGLSSHGTSSNIRAYLPLRLQERKLQSTSGIVTVILMCHLIKKFCNADATDSSLICRPSHDFQRAEETSSPTLSQEKESISVRVSSPFTPKLHLIPRQVLANFVFSRHSSVIHT